MSTLVTYFSQTGHTATLADVLARRLGSDAEPIIETRPREGAWGIVRGALGAFVGRASDIRPPEHDPGAYDLVLIGTPIWGARPAPAVNAWLDRHGDKLTRIGFFCTEGARGDTSAFGRMERRLGRPPAACLAVTEDEIAGDGYDAKIAAFLAELGAE